MSATPTAADYARALALIDLHTASDCPGIGAEDFAAIAAVARAAVAYRGLLDAYMDLPDGAPGEDALGVAVTAAERTLDQAADALIALAVA